MEARILHAAARGARLQSQFYNGSTGGSDWREITNLRTYDGRVHPEDEHLEYGPISTALRERALIDDVTWNTEFNLAIAYLNMRWPSWHQELNDEDYLVALLIAAEALADEGL
jgi:hypothetical protein